MPKQKKPTPARAETNENKPWTSNYPPLNEWLHKIEARCMDQIPVGDPENPRAYLEKWIVNGRVFALEVRADQHGWEIFTANYTNSVDETFADAEKRLGVPPEHKPSPP